MIVRSASQVVTDGEFACKAYDHRLFQMCLSQDSQDGVCGTSPLRGWGTDS
ncbi:MAG: hypothetical protein R3C28_31735 [Pirellulaceae bacterium]